MEILSTVPEPGGSARPFKADWLLVVPFIFVDFPSIKWGEDLI
jgi:hypothetical protein